MSWPADAAERAPEILARIEEAYPQARIELEVSSPLQLLVATILSAQSTDKRVNAVTPALFKRYPDAHAFAEADAEELQDAIRSTGFFRQKTKHIQGCCRALVERFGGEVPDTMENLTSLPGVGRKTASVVLAGAFQQPAIAVDTHCMRVSRRLGLSDSDKPDAIELDLRDLYPEERWADISWLFIWHGRYTCKSRKPNCEACAVPDLCPWYRENLC